MENPWHRHHTTKTRGNPDGAPPALLRCALARHIKPPKLMADLCSFVRFLIASAWTHSSSPLAAHTHSHASHSWTSFHLSDSLHLVGHHMYILYYWIVEHTKDQLVDWDIHMTRCPPHADWASWWIIWMAQLNQIANQPREPKATWRWSFTVKYIWRSPRDAVRVCWAKHQTGLCMPDPDKMSWVDWLFFCFIGTQSKKLDNTDHISATCQASGDSTQHPLRIECLSHTRVERQSLPKSPSTNCLTISNGTTPLNLCQKPDIQHKVTPALVEQKQLDEFLDDNPQKLAHIPVWSHQWPLLSFSTKKEGSLHLIQDYQKCNTMTIKNPYPLPLIPDILNKVSEAKAKYFIKLDVHCGYKKVQIRMEMSEVAFRWTEPIWTPGHVLQPSNSPIDVPDHDEWHLQGTHRLE